MANVKKPSTSRRCAYGRGRYLEESPQSRVLLKLALRSLPPIVTMLSKFARRVTPVASKNLSRAFSVATLDGFGKHLFKGTVAAPYLVAQGLTADTLSTPEWCNDGPKTDKVKIAWSFFYFWNFYFHLT